ncbi:CaiB/BaiF CoA transferase family protein [Agromyces archimandritae]|uniref:CoA transferase n=1 Tax=Agromyces archimandritae TaxID=2781962 RepID=A0A975IPA5_9MICO|nr:CaiB/BaiF CoA-transferase family protein [Agromyces archimandritae]QTX03786.1 CoA transferase [Agromyces archimandritae]
MSTAPAAKAAPYGGPAAPGAASAGEPAARPAARTAASARESAAGPTPLAGIRVVEFAGAGPAPFAAMLLADLGADVVRIERPEPGELPADPADTMLRRRTIVVADLKDADDLARVRALAASADVLVEGFRPGVMERLGLGPEELRTANPRLVYGRMTGWGQSGPWADRVGHDLGYLSITGMLHAIGPAEHPVVPLNLVADYGGGAMFLVTGILAALLERTRTGRGRTIDAAMIDGVAQLGHAQFSLAASGRWRDERAANLIDGGAPFYTVYACADGRHVAVAALEARFYGALLDGLGLDAATLPARDDPANWPELRGRLAAAFASRTRDEWAAAFDGTEACVTPVLSMREAPAHPQAVARGIHLDHHGRLAPAAAPRFDGAAPGRTPARPARSTLDDALAAWTMEEA